jgi:hypothetical protein
MLRRVIVAASAAFFLVAGFHASVAAAPPLFLECRDTVVQESPILVVIANQGEGKLRDAVRHCREFLGGRPAGADR